MNILTPILMSTNRNLLRLIYLRFGNDGSVYVVFPRKKGYQISQEKSVKGFSGQMKISLNQAKNKLINPHISFHPRSQAIHVKTDRKEIYRGDRKVLNMSAIKGMLLFPLCSIVIPDLSYFDHCSQQNFAKPLIIDSENQELKNSLGLEFWIHPVNSYFDISDMPNIKKRAKDTKIIGKYQYQHPKLKKYTCSIIISELDQENHGEVHQNNVKGILVVVFTDDEPYVFQLDPAQ